MSDRITRRELVAGGMAAAAAAALPASAQAAHRARSGRSGPARAASRALDAVVVGGGLSGLMAAWRLRQRGHSVLVLEARDRVGGRIWNHDLGAGHVSERGATFVGPTQDHVLGLARELGIGTFPVYDHGDDLYVAGTDRLTYSDAGPFGSAPPDPSIELDLAELILQIDAGSRSVPVDAPWRAPNAGALDRMTLQDHIDAQGISPRAQQVVAAALRAVAGAEARQLSMLFTLFYTAASGDPAHPGSFERNFNTRGGAQAARIVGGSQALPLAVAARLGPDVVLRAPVRSVEQVAGGVRVHSAGGTLRARRAILAVPPRLARDIAFAPRLTAGRRAIHEHWIPGAITKVAAVYDRPFWREQGLTGQVVATGFPISVAYDDSPPHGRPGVVFGFVGGDNARRYNAMSPAARRRAVIEQLVGFFGPAARRPRQFLETDWTAQRWTRGCPVAIPQLGRLATDGRSLREPVGALHWAGTETATYWNGYMDGAVSAGERAAAEVASEL
jgi:monoamine oxidase